MTALALTALCLTVIATTLGLVVAVEALRTIHRHRRSHK
jgi:hypothetical protein